MSDQVKTKEWMNGYEHGLRTAHSVAAALVRGSTAEVTDVLAALIDVLKDAPDPKCEHPPNFIWTEPNGFKYCNKCSQEIVNVTTNS